MYLLPTRRLNWAYELSARAAEETVEATSQLLGSPAWVQVLPPQATTTGDPVPSTRVPPLAAASLLTFPLAAAPPSLTCHQPVVAGGGGGGGGVGVGPGPPEGVGVGVGVGVGPPVHLEVDVPVPQEVRGEQVWPTPLHWVPYSKLDTKPHSPLGFLVLTQVSFLASSGLHSLQLITCPRQLSEQPY